MSRHPLHLWQQDTQIQIDTFYSCNIASILFWYLGVLSLLLTLILGWYGALLLTSACPKDNFILTAGILIHLHADHMMAEGSIANSCKILNTVYS